MSSWNVLKCQLAFVLAGLAGAVAAEDGFNTSWGSGWRVSVGGAMNGNMRTKVGVRPDGAWRQGIYGGERAAGGASRAAAQAAGDAYDSMNGGRADFPNGGFNTAWEHNRPAFAEEIWKSIWKNLRGIPLTQF